jgi:hypothetical protein
VGRTRRKADYVLPFKTTIVRGSEYTAYLILGNKLGGSRPGPLVVASMNMIIGVRGAALYTVNAPLATSDNYWRRSRIGEEDITIALVERKAALYLISRWESIAQRSA